MSSQNKPIDFTKPVQTRDGKPARILCTDRKHHYCPVVALVLVDGNELIRRCRSDGKYFGIGVNDDDGLINVPPKVVGEEYRNVYRVGSTGQRYTTKSQAQMKGSPAAIGLIKITTYDDGTFDIEKV